ARLDLARIRQWEAAMDTALWIAQVLLAAAMFGAGMLKLVAPIERVTAKMPALASLGVTSVRLIGLAEALGAIGLLAPRPTGIDPLLTPLAAAGLLVVAVGAVATHARRGEVSLALLTSMLGGMAAFIAFASFAPHA